MSPFRFSWNNDMAIWVGYSTKTRYSQLIMTYTFLVLCSSWSSNSFPVYHIFRTSRFLTFSKASTTITTVTMGILDNVHLVVKLFDFLVLSSVEGFVRYHGKWSAFYICTIVTIAAIHPVINVSKLERIDGTNKNQDFAKIWYGFS